ncbi:hypothetical protein [Streptomyces sp. JV190]|uniref:hypothetical protein n=1 Tax=Streptomyces sp. JV190 TaxID=3002533 RepID=UPI002E76488B|nr:hypothetical protein [Streptomyces sp. JV190]
MGDRREPPVGADDGGHLVTGRDAAVGAPGQHPGPGLVPAGELRPGETGTEDGLAPV